jgi:hypothetical protein
MISAMVLSFSTSWAGLFTYLTLASAAALPQDVSSDGEDATISAAGPGGPAATFDYIIVGGGLTGLVAANRLSEDRKGRSR